MPRPVGPMEFGDSEAIYCRWCSSARSRLGVGSAATWFCRHCDSPLHLVRAEPPEPTPA